MTTMSMEQIYTAYYSKVMGYVGARIRNRADAEDLCADIFEKVQRKLGDFDPEKARIGTWIFSITRNTVIDHYRRTRPSEELDENLSDDSEVDENLLQTETLDELASALRSLPQQLMDIIVLRYYDGRPLTEIAKMMGLSYGAVKLRHQNALMMLKERMGALDDDD